MKFSWSDLKYIKDMKNSGMYYSMNSSRLIDELKNHFGITCRHGLYTKEILVNLINFLCHEIDRDYDITNVQYEAYEHVKPRKIDLQFKGYAENIPILVLEKKLDKANKRIKRLEDIIDGLKRKEGSV